MSYSLPPFFSGLFRFPIILFIGITTIPFVSDYSSNLVTEEAASHSVRWFLGHIINGIVFGISIKEAG